MPTTVQPGDRVAAPKVTISVFNASDRVGLADRTMASFEDQGFGAGKVGNAPKGTTVNYAQIWTHEPQNPAVRLVLSRLGPKAHILGKDPSGPGVTVMVGAGFDKLVAGKSSVKVTQPAQICSPPTRRDRGLPGRRHALVEPPAEAAVGRDRAQPLDRGLAQAPGRHDEQVVTAPQDGTTFGHDRLPVAHHHRHRRPRAAAGARRPRPRAAATPG